MTITSEQREVLRRFDDVVRGHEVYLTGTRRPAAEALAERGLLQRERPGAFGGTWYSLTSAGEGELVRMRS